MNFIKSNRLAPVAALALGAAALGLPFATQAGSPLNNINHIIVIYQENWPFDALYGNFPGANNLSNASTTSLTQLDKLAGSQVALSGSSLQSELPQGFTLSNPSTYGSYIDQSYSFVTTNPPIPVNSAASSVDSNFTNSGALKVNTLNPYSLTDPALASLSNAGDGNNSTNYITGDIYHRYLQEQYQINGGKNNLFMTWSDDPGLVLSHFDATDLPEGLMAQQYTLCDNFFHSAFGGSFLNHQFLVACQAPVYPNPPGSILTAVDPTTGILQLAGVGNPVALSNLATTSGSKTVTVANIVGLYKGMPIADSGAAIPGGATIASVVSGTSFTLSVSATASATAETGTASVAIPAGSYFGALANDSKVTPIGAPSFTSYLASLTSGSAVATYDKTYAMNTIYSVNLVPVGTGSAVGTSVLPSINDSNPLGANYEQNIGDLLSTAGVSWKWYSGGWNMATSSSPSNPNGSASNYDATQNFQWHHQPLAYFDNYAPFDTVNTVSPSLVSGSAGITRAQNSAAHLQDETNFFSDVTNNTLPSVCFIKPVGNNNEHPGYAALQVGMAHVQSLIQAVQQNPALWAHTAIIITYDEHGGRWDHVAPPHRDIWGPGLRVPALVISPYAKQGYIDHTQYDTTSIISTIEARFLTSSGSTATINSLDANAPTMANALTNTQITASGFSYNRRTGVYTQAVTVTNLDSSPITGPVNLVLDHLSGNTTLQNKTGTTTVNPPLGSPYVVAGGTLAPGASATASLLFTVPSSGSISYSPRVVSGTSTP